MVVAAPRTLRTALRIVEAARDVQARNVQVVEPHHAAARNAPRHCWRGTGLEGGHSSRPIPGRRRAGFIVEGDPLFLFDGVRVIRFVLGTPAMGGVGLGALPVVRRSEADFDLLPFEKQRKLN